MFYKYILIEKYTPAFVEPQLADVEGIDDVASVLFSNIVLSRHEISVSEWDI